MHFIHRFNRDLLKSRDIGTNAITFHNMFCNVRAEKTHQTLLQVSVN